MNTIIVSSDYKLTLRRDVCERMRLRPGQKMLVSANGGQLRLVPVLNVHVATDTRLDPDAPPVLDDKR